MNSLIVLFKNYLYRPMICNGSNDDSKSFSLGSSPSRASKLEYSSIG